MALEGAETTTQAPATVPPEAGAVAPSSDAGGFRGPRPQNIQPAKEREKGADAPDWRASLPQELRDAVSDAADPAEAAKVYTRGKEYVPAEKAEDIALAFGKGEIHPGLEKMFKEMCVARKLTPAQAQALVEFNGKFAAEAARIHLEHGNAQLEERFGADTGKVKDNALKVFSALDRKMDGRLSQSASGRQIASDPLVVEALYLLHRAMGEDSLGGGAGAGGEDRAMSDKEFFEQVLNKQQGAGAAL
jgi:hypothetical protein